MNWALAIYSLATWLAQPLLRRKLARRSRTEPGYGQYVGERFGHYDPPTLGLDGAGQWVWIHAVSLGETRAAALLVDALRAVMPEMRLLLTHGTATGRAEGSRLLRPGDLQVWQPWDTRGAVRRFVQQFRPAIGVLMETEVWPNLIHICRDEGVPLLLVNARLNQKSHALARRWAALSRPTYRALTGVFAQSTEDAQRLHSLGAPVRAVLGNLKFDVQPDPAALALGTLWRTACPRPIIVLASSREGEETQWLHAWQRLRREPDAKSSPAIQWLIVPRHPQRFDAVHELLSSAGLKVARRSQWGQRLPPMDTDVWLGDSLGEMPTYYAAARLGLLGGSFEPLGGQNLIEAAACGCPMVMGLHTFNFSTASELAISAQAAHRVRDMEQAVRLALALVAEPVALLSNRRAALHFANAHRGAAKATALGILRMLRQAHPG